MRPIQPKPLKRVRASTKAYIVHLVRLQYRIEVAKGTGATVRDCLEKVLAQLNISIYKPQQQVAK